MEKNQDDHIERMKEAIHVAERNIQEMRELLHQLEQTTKASKEKNQPALASSGNSSTVQM